MWWLPVASAWCSTVSSQPAPFFFFLLKPILKKELIKTKDFAINAES
jgi:hypothetical protein